MSLFRQRAHSRRSSAVSSAVKEFFPGLTYVDNSSLLHRLHPLVKLVWLISFSLAVFAVSFFSGGIVLFCLLLIFYGLAGLGLSFFSRKLRFIFIFGLLIFLVQVLTVKEGFLLWQFSLGSASLRVWSEGFREGLKMMLRFINIIASSYLFVSTTDPNRLAYALMQIGLPYRFGFMLITALRFIPVFHRELAQVKNAQMAKGIEIEGLSLRKLWRAIRYLFVPLVISTLSKVDFLTISMESRAFCLYPDRTYMHPQVLSLNDKVAMALVPLIMFIFYLIPFFKVDFILRSLFMPENFLPEEHEAVIIEKKFISRKNNVFLVAVSKNGEKDTLMVQKIYFLPERMAAEYKMLGMLKKKGVDVPGILGRGENYLLLEYLKGQLFLDYYCRQEDIHRAESSEVKKTAYRVACSLCNWFKNFYTATREIAGRQLIMGDVNFRNFIIGEKDKIYGFDLEECREGKIEEDLGSLCAYALTYSPTFTQWKWIIVGGLIKVFCDEFNLDRDFVKKEIQKELFTMAQRRGTLDELVNIPLADLLEKV